jgi:hypothetical protein
MEHDEWMTLEHSLIDEPLRMPPKQKVTMHLVDRITLYLARGRSRTWKRVAKKYRKKYLDEIKAQSWFLQRCYEILISMRKSKHLWEDRSRKLLSLAKEERECFREVATEWEAERDRYQAMMKQRDDACKDYNLMRKLAVSYKNALERTHKQKDDQIDEARRWAIHFKKKSNNLEAALEDEKDWYLLALKERDESIDVFVFYKKGYRHYKELYEQGAPMTIAGMNKKIAELTDRNERLRKALTTVRHSTVDVTCKYCFDNRIVVCDALEESNLHKDFVERYKEMADIGIRLPYAYPTEDDNEQAKA